MHIQPVEGRRLRARGFLAAALTGARLLHVGGKLTREIDPVTGKPKKAPGSRLIKCYCMECGYTVRITRLWLDHGAPTCCNQDCGRQGDALEEG